MLTIAYYKINISRPEVVYDKEKKKLIFDADQSSGKCFRLVYDAENILELSQAVSTEAALAANGWDITGGAAI